ncbi:MAG: hypothetical protein AAGA91_02550 [Pseudomonadota bacterium]
MHNHIYHYALALAVCFLWACSDGSDSGDDSNGDSNGDSGGSEIVELVQMTFDIPSTAQPLRTPGSEGVTVANDKLLSQFGTAPDLNRARYTRYQLSNRVDAQPDAILVLVPGFEGGASNFQILADNLLRKASAESNLALEVWAIDRRSNQLEDTVGLDIAEDLNDPQIGLDFLFGEQLGLTLDPALEDGPNRRAIFYNSSDDIPFLAQWTPLVHSLDIDAVVEAALEVAASGNVFLGGHSAGTGFTARYAATDLNLAAGQPEPGYSKLRGLVLLEGGGSGLSSEPPSATALDLIEAEHDGGLFGAVRDQAARCIDGNTACTADTATSDCAAFENTSCVEPDTAYAVVAGLLSPQLLAISEVNALDAILVGDGVQSILQTDQNGESGNNAVQKVPELSVLQPLVGGGSASSIALLGQFLDDDGLAASLAGFVATSVGAPGPVVEGVATWLSPAEGVPADAVPDNGPAPTTLEDISVWGLEAEPSELEGRMLPIFYQGQTNFSEWYYPSAGLGIGSELGLDTTALSAPPPLGRGRSDIANRTQAGNIDIPVIGFGGSNGLAPVPANWLRFAQAIGPCRAPSCDGMTPRILDENNPNPAFPSYGGASGGFEVYVSVGYAHLDVLTAEDEPGNEVLSPLLDFIVRNLN